MVITNFAPPMDSALGDRLVRLNGSAGPGSRSFILESTKPLLSSIQ